MKDFILKNIMSIQGFNVFEAAEKLKLIQSLNDESFKNWREEKKWDIVNHHIKKNKLYCDKIGSLAPSEWEKLPIMEKSDYQYDIAEMLSNGYEKKSVYISNTSGSSGHPFFFAKDKFSHSMSWAMIEHRYAMHDISLTTKQARFFGIPFETTDWLKEKLKDSFINRLRFPIFDMSEKNIASFINSFKKKKLEYIYGYVNSLILFSRQLIKMNLCLNDICPSLKLCITTSEMLTEFDRKILKRAFGVNIVNEYGVSEVGGIVAIEDYNGNWLINKETQFVEVVNDLGKLVSPGEQGFILITDLFNKAMPFIRYKVGDIGIIHKNKIINGYKVLDKLLGRTNDNIKLPSGKISPGLTFYYISRSILESTGILKEFIIKQTSLDEFIFDIVSDREPREKEIEDIRKKMDVYLEPGLKLKINRVKKIKRPISGKLKHFYSEIGN